MTIDLFNLPVPNIGRIAADGLVHARDLLGFLFVRCFTPDAIALEIVIRRERRHDFLRWFRIVEEILRRVLFLEASAIATSLPPPTPARAGLARTRKPAPVFNREDSTTWRLSLRMTPPAARPHQRKHKRGRREPRIVVPSRPLALRMQAVLRALEDPHPYIQRLALRLRKGLPAFAIWRLSSPASTAAPRQPCVRSRRSARQGSPTPREPAASLAGQTRSTCGIAATCLEQRSENSESERDDAKRHSR